MWRIVKNSLLGLGVATGVGFAVVTVNVSRKEWSEQHSFGAALKQYFLVGGLNYFGKSQYRKIDKDCQDVKTVQEETLLAQLQVNMDTVYGKDHYFHEIKSREDFIRMHPLTRYPYYKPYVDRITQGEKQVLTKDDPIILALTSGTSGTRSMMPMLKNQTAVFFKYGVAPCYYLMTENIPGAHNLQKDLKFFYTPKPRELQAGIPVGPNSSNPQNSKQIWSMYTTPPAAYDIVSEPEATYVYLLFALKDRKVGILEANFVSIIYNAMQSLENNWKQLVNDIETGTLNPELKIDSEVRQKLQKLLQPDPKRSEELRSAFSEGMGGIVRRVWPQCHLVLSVDTGSMELYGRLMRQSYSWGVPHYSPLYGATEGLIGLNIDPLEDDRTYLLVPRAMFFEFIPVEDADKVQQPKTLFMDQVELGSTYELVITNMSCLYRYRLGDVVRVKGFHHQCPKVEFLYRQGQFLNVRGEKVSERMFYESIMEASQDWDRARLTDYCCVPSALLNKQGQSDDGPHYVVFVELEGQHDLTKTEKQLIDEKLCKKSFSYESFRQKKSISPMEVIVVRPGTFQDLKHFMVSNDEASSNQYKVPRVLVKPEAISFVLSRMVQ